MALVVLKRFDNSIEASLARSFLASEGVTTFLFDVENEWNTFPRIQPVRLMVAEEDLDEAALLLRAAETRAAAARPGAA